MRVHWLQHVPFEGLGSIEPWMRARGHSLSCTRLHAGEVPPSAGAFDWVVVMGGPMNVYEEREYPWLVAEKRCIREAVAMDRRVLGICLGAQLLADVLGAKVTRNAQKEIGWFPVELTSAARRSDLFADFPACFEAYHWHGDTFGIPAGALHIAGSRACTHQAFVAGTRSVGLQFHLETTPQSAQDLIDNARNELVPAPCIQDEAEMLADPARFGRLNGLMSALLGRLEQAS